MTGIVEIPLAPSKPVDLHTTLDGVAYNLRLTFNIAQGGCWILDIGDAVGNMIVVGIPLVSGSDLLAQYRHLGFTGSLVVTTDRGAGEVPGFADLGRTAHLFYIPDATS